MAFPYSYPRPVGGADWPHRERLRRDDAAPVLGPWEFAASLAARVEGSIRNDWILVPAMRNLTTKWAALTGDDVACKHVVDTQKPGQIHAAELADAAANLYKKLAKGYWTDGKKRRKINHDLTKLPYAENLSPLEKNLVKDLSFLSSKIAGTQQIRLQIGHALFGARVEYGDPIFLTISPSSRRSGMCVRLSRYREIDPALEKAADDPCNRSPWHRANRPTIWANDAVASFDLPEYAVRQLIAARDPWAVVLNFTHSIKFVGARLQGIRMCPNCPRCNATDTPCQNKFGHGMLPMGGLFGLAVAFGGAVEYQKNWNPHFHGNTHVASVYQHKTLQEIADLMSKALLDPQAVIDYQSWVCREDHFDHERHISALNHLERQWKDSHQAREHDDLCQLPVYIRDDSTRSLWSADSPFTQDEASEDAENFQRKYFDDAQSVLSRCHHHWHPKDERTGARHPIAGCRSKRDRNACRAKFPLTKRLTLKPKIICRGNCRRHDLRVSGRRNALGTILTKRRCEWLSGTAPGFAVVFRHNTHTAPNYRMPLTAATHDPQCKADCLQGPNMKKMIACSQRAQRNTTGYFTGYVQKRQPVGKFELAQAAANLQYLSKSISGRSNKEQFHRMANRMLGDLEFRGQARTATEEFKLAANWHHHDVKKRRVYTHIHVRELLRLSVATACATRERSPGN